MMWNGMERNNDAVQCLEMEPELQYAIQNVCRYR